jgi:hypothetical protein
MGGFRRYKTDPGDSGGSTSSAGTPGPIGRNDEADRLACNKGVSWELDDACDLPDPPGFAMYDVPQRKVAAWLMQYAAFILKAEQVWSVDRCAIAGAIAFEALKNVQSNMRHNFSRRSWGPGKIHVGNWYSMFQETSTTLIETWSAGYLTGTGIDPTNLSSYLATAEGSIVCIAAIMRADADAAVLLGGYAAWETYWNAPVLAAWFQGKHLWDLVNTFTAKGFDNRQHPLQPGQIPMGVWVQSEMKYLQKCVGITREITTTPAPFPGAKSLVEVRDAASPEPSILRAMGP